MMIREKENWKLSTLNAGKQTQTQFHQIVYDDKNPENFMIELCASCYANGERWLGQLCYIIRVDQCKLLLYFDRVNKYPILLHEMTYQLQPCNYQAIPR